jgi:hypothetical protein
VAHETKLVFHSSYTPCSSTIKWHCLQQTFSFTTSLLRNSTFGQLKPFFLRYFPINLRLSSQFYSVTTTKATDHKHCIPFSDLSKLQVYLFIMAILISESASLRSRRRKCDKTRYLLKTILTITITETFTTSCPPDELLSQIIETLRPKYRIDAPHLLALRKVLSNAIVTPKKAPKLMRAHPDTRVGQTGSIYATPRSLYGINGPPMSTDQSFYFHHQDPEFRELLPHIDCSRYNMPDESTSQGGVQTIASEFSVRTPRLTACSLPSASVTALAPTDRKKRAFEKTTCCPKKRCQVETPETTPGSNQTRKLSLKNRAQKDLATNLEKLSPRFTPSITIASIDWEQTSAIDEHKTKTALTPLLHATDVFINLPDIQDIYDQNLAFSSRAPHLPRLPDTQDTFTSTQQSELFSQPANSLPCSPPT